MSTHTHHTPECNTCDETPEVELVISGRPRDIGAFEVRRVLPSSSRRMVGPFIFFDQMGPATLEVGQAMDVRPHPHINLATVTYLFEGRIDHRDSLGYHQAIEPGAINWMTAGKGIAHSERSTEADRKTTRSVFGIQLWVALPTEHEEVEPSFDHYPADSIPSTEHNGVKLRILVGNAYGETSPVKTLSRMFYVEAILPAGSELSIPTDYPERAAYCAEGKVTCGSETGNVGHMLVFSSGSEPVLRAETDSRIMLLGGEPLGKRHIWWNFVSSSKERIEKAKADWKEGRFPKVVGDDAERIPLPER